MPLRPVTLVSIDMGYGHLRAAQPLSEVLGTPVLHADRPPLADPDEQRTWARTRDFYAFVTRASQWPWVGAPLRGVVQAVTDIPRLMPERDLSRPDAGAWFLEMSIRTGTLGRGLRGWLERTDSTLLTPFYSPAIAADRLGWDRVFCVVTDSDIARPWVPVEPSRTRITYLTPSGRASRRLAAYGVPADRIRFTGFPLPPSLLGGPGLEVAKRNLAGRLIRLDPGSAFLAENEREVSNVLGPLPREEAGRPPLVVFAVGGTGAQAGFVADFLPGMKAALRDGRLRLGLIAGLRREVEQEFLAAIDTEGLGGLLGTGIRIVCEDGWEAYYRAMNAMLADADVLWTKPSEMVFYAALGHRTSASASIAFMAR